MRLMDSAPPSPYRADRSCSDSLGRTADKEARIPLELIVLLALLPVIFVTASVLLVRWVVAELLQESGTRRSGRADSPLRSRLSRWFRPMQRLDYRRDKRGRFRKVRRG